MSGTPHPTLRPAGRDLAPTTIPGATTVTVDHAATMFDEGVVFIGVRKASDYEAGRVLGAVNLDVKTEFSEDSPSTEIGNDEAAAIAGIEAAGFAADPG